MRTTLVYRLTYLLSLIVLSGCDEPTKWKDQGQAPCVLACELRNTQWFRTYENGAEWEWLFKEGSFLAGSKGLLNPIVGNWRVEHGGVLKITDNACYDPETGYQPEGTYFYFLRNNRLEIGAFEDECTPRKSLAGVWQRALNVGAPPQIGAETNKVGDGPSSYSHIN